MAKDMTNESVTNENSNVQTKSDTTTMNKPSDESEQPEMTMDNKKMKRKKLKKDKDIDKTGIRDKLVLKEEKKTKRAKKKRNRKEETSEEVPLIDEKLILEEEKQKKVRTPRKVKPKKYKEPKDEAKKLFVKREKFTRKFFRRIKSRAKGQIDILIKKDYYEAEKRAKTLLGITERDYQQQVLITVPDSFTNKNDVRYHLEVEKEGNNKLYFDQAYVTILFYSLKSLYIYQCNIDHRTGFIGHDRAQEFNYFDVVSVETEIKYDRDDRPKYSILNAALTLSNDQKFLIRLRNQRLNDQTAGQALLSQKEQHVLQMLKDRIRASKV